VTPPAATAAGNRTKSRVTHRAPTKRVPRRVSVPAAPRRVSGPLPARERLVPLHQRLAKLIRTLPDRALLDRIVRGRAWIPLLGVMLAGIVAMQVELLKLNASIGRSIELGAALQSRNDTLRANVSSLSDAQRIERLASGMGMVMAGPTSVQFLDARHVDPAKAAANIHSPDPASFQAALQAMLSSATQSTTGQGATSSTSAAAPTPTATSGAATSNAGTAAATATSAGPATSATSTAPSTPTTTVTPTGAATAPIGRPVTPAGGAAAPSGGAVAPTGATATGTSGSPSAR
jgi:DNA polymerase III subunit gamma/tau